MYAGYILFELVTVNATQPFTNRTRGQKLIGMAMLPAVGALQEITDKVYHTRLARM
jgi:hypothetical protein